MKKIKKQKYVQPARKEERSRRQSLMPLVMIAVLAVAIIIGVVAVTANDNRGYTSSTSQKQTQSNQSNPNQQEEGLKKADVAAESCYADIEIEGYGTITVYLDAETAPITVNNFVSLAKSGFYDGLTFHRIMEGFMMQGGDPMGNGTGGSDETIIGEFAYNGYENNIQHVRGTISMARSTAYNSASSQFFIMHEDTYGASLDGQYAAFGYVTEGMEVVDKVCEEATPIDSNGTILRDQQPVIKTITIRETEEK